MTSAIGRRHGAAPLTGAGEFFRQAPDVVAAGLALPVAVWLTGDPLAISPFMTKALPVALVLIAAIMKLIDQPRFPAYSLAGAVFGALWCATFYLIPIFWLLFLTLRLPELSSGLFIALWFVLAALLLPVRLAGWARISMRAR